MRKIKTFSGPRCRHTEIQPMPYTFQVFLTNCYCCITIAATHTCTECGRSFCRECADVIYEEHLYD